MPDDRKASQLGVIDQFDNALPDHLAFARELQELAQQAINGDKNSYRVFLEKLMPHVRRYVRKQWWGDDNSEEDLMQDVLIAVHTNLHTYDPTRPILPWVRSIVTYKVADFLGKFSRWHFNEVGSDNIETFSSFETNNHEKSIESIDYVERALETLSDKHAHIVRMLKIDGLSLKEVSDRTGLSVAAVKTNAHRAYKKIVEFQKENT